MYRFFILYNTILPKRDLHYEINMLAIATKNVDFDKYSYFEKLPAPVKALIQDINVRQRYFSALLSDNNTPFSELSLSSFIEETQSKVKSLIFNLDEVVYESEGLTSLIELKKTTSTFSKSTHSLLSNLDELHTIVETLLENLTQLNDFFYTNNKMFFLLYLHKKSLLFYQQTSVVLKAYIRLERDKKC